MRWILYDWPDTYAVQILGVLIPVLTQGSEVAICEHVMLGSNSMSNYKLEARGAFSFLYGRESALTYAFG